METKVKNREWVKDAAIIFLAVLLVLTFFSNTIMNRSLPEVATAQVTNGSIVAKVRGSGTVTANGKHQVKAKETRTIRSVMIKAGQEVSAGDVLFVLGEGDVTALEQAKDTLRDLQYAYQKSAVNIATFDDASYRRSIEKARIAVENAEREEAEAKKAYDTAVHAYGNLSDAELRAAEEQLAAYKIQMEVAEMDLEEAKENLDKLSENVVQAQQEVQYCQQTLDAINQRIAELEANTQDSATPEINSDSEITQFADSSLDGAIIWEENSDIVDDAAVFDDAADSLSVGKEKKGGIVLLTARTVTPDRGGYVLLSSVPESELSQLKIEKVKAEAALEEAQTKLAQIMAQEGVDSSKQSAYEQTLANYNKCKDQYYRALSEYEKKIPINALTYKDAYEDAVREREAAEYDYQAAVDAYNYASDSFNRSVAVSYLDLQQQAEKIALQQEKIKSLAGDEENVITANVSGTIDTIDCTAGDTVLKDALLCTIEVPDMGHTLTFSVTNDQAQRLRIGDSATVSNYYWGNSVTATLTSIRTDPKNPQGGKLLTFDLTGDVTTGSELTISVGQKSANYDLIVPNSSIKNDSNGSFVLAVTVKSSPLGNRYTARRVSIEVLASDDNNSAVVADLTNGDYVITTSSAPIKSGDMVRMADNS